MSVWKVLDWVVDSLSTVLLLAMSVVLALEIFFRYLLNRPLVWTLEVSLFCFVWLMWIGAIGSIREERQIRIDFVEKYAPLHLRKFLVPFTTLLSMAFLILVIYYGVYVTESQMSAVFDILPFSRAVQYAAAPIGGTLMLLSLARVFVRQVHRYFPGQKG